MKRMLLPRALEEMALDFVPVTDLYIWPYLDPSYFHRRWHRVCKTANLSFMQAPPGTWKEQQGAIKTLRQRLKFNSTKTIPLSVNPDVYLLSLIVSPRPHMTVAEIEMSFFINTTGRRIMFNHIHTSEICSLLWGFREIDNTHQLIFERSNGNKKIVVGYLKFLVNANRLDEGAHIIFQYVIPSPPLTLLVFKRDELQPLHQVLATTYPIDRIDELISLDGPNGSTDYENYVYLSSRHNDLARRYFQSLEVISAMAVWVLVERQESVAYIEEVMSKVRNTPASRIVYARVLIRMIMVGSYDHVALLVRYGADVNYVETKVLTFNHVSSLKGYMTQHGDTPLHVAVTYERHKMIKYLVSAGVDPLMVNHKGINAIQHARNWRCLKVAAYLEAVVQARS